MKEYTFDAEKALNKTVEWIRSWFSENGNGCNAVVGISGGKDSSIVAALCVRALGKERVVGVLMPNGVQSDIDVARDLVRFLDIKSYEINIEGAYKSLICDIEKAGIEPSEQTTINIQPRLRMSTVYAVSQSVNGRVANTCNLSEDWVGYSTRYGDSVGDFSPISCFTVAEVKQIARAAGLDEKFIEKVPTDGISGKSDEDKLGFTYEMLDRYIRTGVCEDEEKKARIDYLHKINLFKLRYMDCFKYEE